MRVPPLLVGFPSTEAFLRAASNLLSSQEQKQFARFAEKGIPPVTSMYSLAILFQYSVRFVIGMALRPARYYRTFQISKGKGNRRIDAPRVALKAIQTWFGHYLARAVKLDSSVHGFVPGLSIVTAARVHCGAQWVLTLDIRDFFPSVTEDSVVRVLLKVGYSRGASKLLARLFTLNSVLPQGSPASPVLANLAFSKTDARLITIAKRYGASYTRYADDLTFSGRGTVDHVELKRQIVEAVKSDGWRIADRKTREVEAPRRLVVLGLIVNGSRPRLSKRMRNQIRMMNYLSAKADLNEQERQRMRGYIAFARSIGEVAQVNRDRPPFTQYSGS
jgi:RNA-directed DNA polymerase